MTTPTEPSGTSIPPLLPDAEQPAAAATTAPANQAPPAPGSSSPPASTFQERVQEGARAFDERAQSLGREAEAAVNRLGANPAIRDTADAAARLWGLLLLAAGLWLVGAVTLKLDLPSVAWGDLWPLALVVVGGLVVVQGFGRRR